MLLQGYDLATQLGHSIVKPVPSLFTFKIDDLQLIELSGVVAFFIYSLLSQKLPCTLSFYFLEPQLLVFNICFDCLDSTLCFFLVFANDRTPCLIAYVIDACGNDV